MSLEDFRSAWRAASSAAPPLEEMDNLIRNMIRSERRGRILLTVCAINAVLALLLTLSVFIFRRPVALNEALPAMGLQTIATFGLAWIIRRHHQRRRMLESSTATVHEAARSGLEVVNSEIRDGRVLLGLFCVMLPLLAVAVRQLIASGKMNAQAATCFALLCGVVAAVNAFVQWRKYRRTLAPRRRRLRQILASLEEAS